MLRVVHHPDYIGPAPPGSDVPSDKYGLVMDALRESGADIEVHTPEPMPRGVHQGDGTAALTADEPSIFTLSIHAERNFPVRKARSTLDVSLPDGIDDEGYLAALAAVLPDALDRFAPGLILYQAGVDPHAGDRFGRLAMTDAGLDARDRYVMRQARARGIAVASTLGGGYASNGGDDRRAVARRHAATMVALADEAAGMTRG